MIGEGCRCNISGGGLSLCAPCGMCALTVRPVARARPLKEIPFLGDQRLSSLRLPNNESVTHQWCRETPVSSSSLQRLQCTTATDFQALFSTSSGVEDLLGVRDPRLPLICASSRVRFLSRKWIFRGKRPHSCIKQGYRIVLKIWKLTDHWK